ncbi:MAG: division/cell wall cluster transcriptional repressor MraZ [Candidatus Marinimicrobia bacterium]|nr:division/cell wall cluster transcriptional repressor MraZ [Candidatus Neomarinimicrobiota bacterium]MBL7010379.1 division/cell wall cluster transcriptional repressor MraZ [Candidatus Neomarinimicrobiota bacterium]MBL7030770.1 division/cell wall cluster transcriptional repressor MraZ [Candidatus Neomarinimicrobiota bacterium]
MTINQNTFTGEYSYSLDAKGRVNIPAKFRNVLTAENDQSFVITRGMDPCVWVYPIIVWQSIEDELRKLSSLSQVNRSFVRSTVRYASSVQYDKQGRIAVSPNLIEYAQLEKEVLILGMVNKIEIWNPALLDSADKQSQEIDSSQFDELANQIIL